MKIKKRLDAAVAELHPDLSRQQIQSLIMQGLVKVDDKPVTKPGFQIADDAIIAVKYIAPKYVSRAGFKLEGALQAFNLDVTGLTIMDAGISTGGFSDCLLQHGAAKIYGVDVGYGQVHEKIRQDPRVVIMERTNLRNLKDLGELVDLVTLDLSFISVLKVMDTVSAVLKPNGTLVILIKPQFEAEREDIGKGGIVRDPAVHERVIQKVIDGVTAHGFTYHGVVPSPIEGATGNKEFLAYFVKN
jgi:23S rRNA (cytidine1920-2'-O)/16S rRNA (cytidine1409-2'-O)-methyltransferase